MGVLIQIAGQFFSRILIAFIAWSFTFIGHDVNIKINPPTSVPQVNTSPLFVEIDEENVNIEKNKIIENIGTSTATTSSKNKIPTPATVPTPPKISLTVETPKATSDSIIENPSLKNIPVPTISLAQISEEIKRSSDLGEWGNIYTNSKQSIVNIFCVGTKGNMISISTGSGIVLHKSGIILTNSHVAENFLIPEKDCSIRQGEIAVDKYKASPIYINEKWLEKNASALFSQSARGTGENDFALLGITKKIDNSNLDSNIPYTNINSTELTENNRGQKILIAGYPAGTLGTLSLRKYLSFVADVINISNVYTLDGSHVDVFETDITKVGQHGSSGGGIFDLDNKLIGLIVSVNDESGNSKVNAITTTYISRAMKDETGKTLGEFINTDKNILLNSFLLKKDDLFGYVKPFLQ